jgi:hypothetical protein
VQRGNITPGQYLVMSIDFSTANRSKDLNIAMESLQETMNSSIKAFYTTYAPYLGTATSAQLIDKYVGL